MNEIRATVCGAAAILVVGCTSSSLEREPEGAVFVDTACSQFAQLYKDISREGAQTTVREGFKRVRRAADLAAIAAEANGSYKNVADPLVMLRDGMVERDNSKLQRGLRSSLDACKPILDEPTQTSSRYGTPVPR